MSANNFYLEHFLDVLFFEKLYFRIRIPMPTILLTGSLCLNNVRGEKTLAKFIESHDVEWVECVHLKPGDLELSGAVGVHVVKLVTLSPRPLPTESKKLLEAAVEARLPGQDDRVVACAENWETQWNIWLWCRYKNYLLAARTPDVGGLDEKVSVKPIRGKSEAISSPDSCRGRSPSSEPRWLWAVTAKWAGPGFCQ